MIMVRIKLPMRAVSACGAREQRRAERADCGAQEHDEADDDEDNAPVARVRVIDDPPRAWVRTAARPVGRRLARRCVVPIVIRIRHP